MMLAISNKFGNMLRRPPTTEIAVGGTRMLYGDTVGAGIIGDLSECEVYDLARHINRDRNSFRSIRDP